MSSLFKIYLRYITNTHPPNTCSHRQTHVRPHPKHTFAQTVGDPVTCLLLVCLLRFAVCLLLQSAVLWSGERSQWSIFPQGYPQRHPKLTNQSIIYSPRLGVCRRQGGGEVWVIVSCGFHSFCCSSWLLFYASSCGDGDLYSTCLLAAKTCRGNGGGVGLLSGEGLDCSVFWSMVFEGKPT